MESMTSFLALFQDKRILASSPHPHTTTSLKKTVLIIEIGPVESQPEFIRKVAYQNPQMFSDKQQSCLIKCYSLLMLFGIILISLAYFLDPDSTEVSTSKTEPAADPLIQDVNSHKITNIVVNIGLVLHEFWKNYLVYAAVEFYWYSVIVFNAAYCFFSFGTIAAVFNAQILGGKLVSLRTCKITGTLLLISNWVRFALRSYLDHQ